MLQQLEPIRSRGCERSDNSGAQLFESGKSGRLEYPLTRKHPKAQKPKLTKTLESVAGYLTPEAC